MSGFLTRAFQPREARSSVSLTSPEIIKLLMGSNISYTGEAITVEGALNVTAVMAGFTILMEDVASLPLILYRRIDRGKERATSHPYYSLLHDNPNPEHTSMVFREMVIGHLLGWGNFYGQLLWDGRGVVREIWPLAPNRMEVFRENGERRYLYTEQNGHKTPFRQEEILHIPAFGFDGLIGYSRISLARNAIGLARAAEKYGSKFFANDSRPSVLFTSPNKMSKEAKQDLRESWMQLYSGADNAAKAAVLDSGLDFKTIGFPPEDAQFLQTRQFQINEIARIFRIPPHMLGEVEKSTSWGSGIEQQELGYLSHTLRPWLVRIEQQFHKDLLITRERRNYTIEHLTEAMLRTDTKSRAEAYASAITNGWMNRNEVREKENLNPYEGGDEFLTPLNMTTDPGDDSTTDGNPSTNIEPLLLDAAERALRREGHEVRDAARRWLDRGKPERFQQWLNAFYEDSQPTYMREIFQPFLQAGLLGQRRLAQVAAAHSEAQIMHVNQALAEQSDLEKDIESWQGQAPAIVAAMMESEA